MRFLIDENLSPRLAELLRTAGHDAVHVRDLGLASAPDEVVMSAAGTDLRTLISADTDFGTTLARTGATAPSFLLIRRASGRRATEQAVLIVDNLEAIAEDLAAGAIVVLGERALRIRRLPISTA
jgi:predicted nuclease of predicted toxin-antitoxin system